VKLEHVLRCQRSGVPVGRLELITAAGALPYLSLWQDSVVYHPLFSVEFHRLLEHTKQQWNEAVSCEELTEQQEQELRLCFMALLYSLDSIKQDIPSLPPIEVVKDNLGRLVRLASWKFWLESKRLKFPTLVLSRRNGNLDFGNIADYIEVCEETRRNYEEGISEAREAHKLRETEKALALLAGEWTKPISKQLLWRWVRAHLPAKYEPDAQGWLGTLFLGNRAAIIEFEREDIDLMDEILQSALPTGSGILHHIRKRIQEVVSNWESYHEAWEILPEQPTLLVNGERVAASDPGPEPKLVAFPSRGMWLQAMARWRLAKAAWERQQ